MLKTLRSRQGFTLIELMIVVVIIGILAALAIPRFTDVAKNARQKEAEPILKQIHTMQETYRAAHGGYAAALTDLENVGWQDPSASLKHFDATSWAIVNDNEADPPTFCVGLDNADDDLEPRSIDQDALFYASTDCSGTVVGS